MNSLKRLLLYIREWMRMNRIAKDPAFAQERRRSVLIRLVHAIEKGLSLAEPRPGFGLQKLEKLWTLCAAYEKDYGDGAYCLRMATDAVAAYMAYHASIGYQSPEIASLAERFSALAARLEPAPEAQQAGGVQTVTTPDAFPISALLRQRHSVREFTGEPVPRAAIERAVCNAQACPSACNRQAVRVYSLPAAKLLELYDSNLSGIGGFAEAADRFLLVTGKISAYDAGEVNQFVVSAGMFASYLTLTLMEEGVGSCIVQRPLQDSKSHRRICAHCGIPADEQIVLMMAVGGLKQTYRAPVSGRFPTEEILRFCDEPKGENAI